MTPAAAAAAAACSSHDSQPSLGISSFPVAHLSDVRRLQMSLEQKLDCPVDQLVLFLWLHNKNTVTRPWVMTCGRQINKEYLHRRASDMKYCQNAALLVGVVLHELEKQKSPWSEPARASAFSCPEPGQRY